MSQVPVRSEILSADSFWADPFGGGGFLFQSEENKRVWIKFCEEDRKWRVRTLERMDPYFEQNRIEYNESSGKKFGSLAKVASIPLPIYFRKYLPARQNGDDKYVAKLLNDSDNLKLRTRPGRL